MLIEILIIASNLVLAHVTFLVVPEEHRPHAIRKVHHHCSRLIRTVTRKSPAHVGAHRLTREIHRAN